MKVLIAEDDPISCALLKSTLEKWGYDLVVCKNGTQAWEALQKEDAPRLAILDWMMPGMSGIDICREIRKQIGQPYVYVILLTSRSHREDMLAGLDAGADDYLTKPFNAKELQLRMRAGTRILELQAELITAREELRIQATHDLLTGLWNRRAVLENLEHELIRAKRQNIPLGLILTDLDFFKRVNDTYGHAMGDSVLRETAHRIRTGIRPYDAVGRYGGEEFLIVTPGCDSSNVLIVSERLRAYICAEPIQTCQGSVKVTASFGVASSVALPHLDADGFIHAADEALYRAKAAGINRIEVATEKDTLSFHLPDNREPLSAGGGPASV